MFQRFGSPVLMKQATATRMLSTLARLDIAGGAVHDALEALAAIDTASSW